MQRCNDILDVLREAARWFLSAKTSAGCGSPKERLHVALGLARAARSADPKAASHFARRDPNLSRFWDGVVLDRAGLLDQHIRVLQLSCIDSGLAKVEAQAERLVTRRRLWGGVRRAARSPYAIAKHAGDACADDGAAAAQLARHWKTV